MSRLIVVLALAWCAWRDLRDDWRASRAPHVAWRDSAPPTECLPQPSPDELDRLWTLVRDAQSGDVR